LAVSAASAVRADRSRCDQNVKSTNSDAKTIEEHSGSISAPAVVYVSAERLVAAAARQLQLLQKLSFAATP
jgi:hypothetical protein